MQFVQQLYLPRTIHVWQQWPAPLQPTPQVLQTQYNTTRYWALPTVQTMTSYLQQVRHCQLPPTVAPVTILRSDADPTANTPLHARYGLHADLPSAHCALNFARQQAASPYTNAPYCLQVHHSYKSVLQQMRVHLAIQPLSILIQATYPLPALQRPPFLGCGPISSPA